MLTQTKDCDKLYISYKQSQIHATNPFILLGLYLVVMYYKSNGHTMYPLDNVWNSITILVVKIERDMMCLLRKRSVPAPVYIEVDPIAHSQN